MGEALPGDDVPIRLSDAVTMFFPAGALTLSALRTEARKGRLATVTIAGKQFVTRKAIMDMIELCRDQNSRPASPSDASRTDAASGSSEKDSGISAQDALRARLNAPVKRSQHTSGKGTGPTRRNVVPLRSS